MKKPEGTVKIMKKSNATEYDKLSGIVRKKQYLEQCNKVICSFTVGSFNNLV